MDTFVPIRFRTSIQLPPSDLVADFQQVLLNRVKGSLEGICSRYGYIRPGSISILKRSVGSFVKQHFNGHIKFDMICRAEVCNPSVGAIFEAVVRNKNALGVHAESVIKNKGTEETVMDIIIPKRSVGIVSTIDLEGLNVGDRIYVEVLGKRYQLNDKKISIIARAIKEPPKLSSLQQDASVTDEMAIAAVVDEEAEGEEIEQFVDLEIASDQDDNPDEDGDNSGSDTEDDGLHTRKEEDEDDHEIEVGDEDEIDVEEEGGADDDYEESGNGSDNDINDDEADF